MAIDSKGNNHQPKGTPNAGRFAPKAGAGDDDDLHEDSSPGMYRPRCMPGNWLGGGFAPPTKASTWTRTCAVTRVACGRTPTTWRSSARHCL